MKQRIGDWLIEAGLVSAPQLQKAEERKRAAGGRLVSHCLSMGYADERTLAGFLSQQLGTPFVVLAKSAIPLQSLALLPLEVACQLNALPLRLDGNQLVLAMADPQETRLVDELRFLTGLEILAYGALLGPLQEAIAQGYKLAFQGGQALLQGAALDPAQGLDGAGHLELVGATVPLAPAAPPGAGPESVEAPTGWERPITKVQPAPPGPQKTVLVVDDDETLRGMLATYLVKSGYTVWEAADGRRAIEILQTGLPDAILLDAMLPGVHGFAICKRVKNALSTRHIPVIMISAIYKGHVYVEKVRMFYGANAYIEKPLKLSFLKQVLSNCLTGREGGPRFDELHARVIALSEQAGEAHQLGDWAHEKDLLQQILAIAPFFASTHARLADACLRLNETYRAIGQLEQAAELEASYPILFRLAMLYEEKGFTRKAKETWAQCIKVCENPVDCERLRAHLERLGS